MKQKPSTPIKRHKQKNRATKQKPIRQQPRAQAADAGQASGNRTGGNQADCNQADCNQAGRNQAGRNQADSNQTDGNQHSQSGERINRYLASCGLCSRREADRWVSAGRVIINNVACQEPGSKVQPGDIVMFDGKVVSPQEKFTYILYNKPTGQLCSRKDAIRKRPLIYDFLNVAPNVQSVGRLDMDSEGLLILTDDGALTRALTKPGAKVPREYRARVAGMVSMETMEKLRRGDIDMGKGDSSDAWEVTVNSESKGHTWLTIIIYRGRWREVRRTLEECGHPVRRLIRTRFASLRLEEGMPSGSFRNLNRAEIKKLKERLA